MSIVGIPGFAGTSISISLLFNSPDLSFTLNFSLVSLLALSPTNASKTFSSAFFSALALTALPIFSFVFVIAISTRSLTICSTSLPTYPTSVNFVASTFTKGASANFASLLDISVLPQPVGPIISMFFGIISSLIEPDIFFLLHLFLNAIATDFFALF